MKLDIYPVLLVIIQHSYISRWYLAIYVFLASSMNNQKTVFCKFLKLPYINTGYFLEEQGV